MYDVQYSFNTLMRVMDVWHPSVLLTSYCISQAYPSSGACMIGLIWENIGQPRT